MRRPFSALPLVFASNVALSACGTTPPDEDALWAERLDGGTRPDTDEDASGDTQLEDTGTGDAVVDPLAGDQCDDAVRIVPGVTEEFSLLGYTNDYTGYTSDACGMNRTSRGADMVFVVEVPAGSTLVATERETSGYDATIAFASTCDDIVSSCLAYRDDPDGTDLRWTNPYRSAIDVFIVADTFAAASSGSSVGAFRLEVVIE